MADTSDIEFLRRLIDETNAQPKAKMPGTLSLMLNHPGILTSETKSPQQYDQDMRRKYFLDKAGEYFENPMSAPTEMRTALLKYQRGEMDDLGTPYEYQGLFQGRAPTAKGFQWWASLPATAYNAAKLAGDAIAPGMYPEAGKNMAKAANTFGFGFPEDVGLVPRGTGTIVQDYDQEREARGSVPWYQLDADTDFRRLADQRQAAIDEAVPSGGQYLQSVGADVPGVNVWGGVMDSMLDPFTATASTLKAARAGAPQAMRMFLGDHAIGVGLPLVGESPAVYDQVDKMIDRLHGVRR